MTSKQLRLFGKILVFRSLIVVERLSLTANRKVLSLEHPRIKYFFSIFLRSEIDIHFFKVSDDKSRFCEKSFELGSVHYKLFLQKLI